jgi:tRNASer (uridine44-2'-O)-methyltransferase
MLSFPLALSALTPRAQDIGIATFLMLLWKDTYSSETIPPLPVHSSDGTGTTGLSNEPWRRWPRPPGGFVDLGCGNGLLTHILVSEGYAGHGFDLRKRTSWAHYPPATQSRLLVRALDPTTATADQLLPADCFLIGNHADELTPWVPLLATRVRASGYLSIPCCAWGLDARFDRSRDVPRCDVDTETLNLGGGGDGGGSSYTLYRVWLASLSVHCGWAVEVEMLRIPSTRNWAIAGECHRLFLFHHIREFFLDLCPSLGRKRVGSLEAADDNVEELIEGVRKRGQFKTRHPEGKAGGDH